MITPSCFSALQRAENSSIVDVPATRDGERPFQCSSASRKFLNQIRRDALFHRSVVSVLFSEPKIPQFQRDGAGDEGRGVSVLFSEPKIPQCMSAQRTVISYGGFSALQRAENSSITPRPRGRCSRACSFSALQRAENSSIDPITRIDRAASRFSALQRAENSSMLQRPERAALGVGFQCSSASRKFLNLAALRAERRHQARFSALQRAENSSIG